MRPVMSSFFSTFISLEGYGCNLSQQEKKNGSENFPH